MRVVPKMAWASVVTVHVVTSLFSCVVLHFSFFLCHSGSKSLVIAESSTVSTRNPLNQHKESLRYLPDDYYYDETTERTSTASFVEDYELDYPRVIFNASSTTTRIPKPLKRYPYRGMIQPKCEARDEGKFFSDTHWCQVYYLCLNGYLYIQICPELMYYNPDKVTCDQQKGDYVYCMKKQLRLNIGSWRKVTSSYYWTTESAWVTANMTRTVVPYWRVTTPDYGS